MNYNRILVIGRLGAPAELAFTSNGKAYSRFRIAENPRPYQNTAGEMVTPPPRWHSVQVWGAQAEALSKVEKGSVLFVDGEMEYRSYESNKFKDAEGKPATFHTAEIRAQRVIFGARPSASSAAPTEEIPTGEELAEVLSSLEPEE